MRTTYSDTHTHTPHYACKLYADESGCDLCSVGVEAGSAGMGSYHRALWDYTTQQLQTAGVTI